MFELQEGHRMIETAMRQFLEKEVVPLIDDLEEGKVLPYDIMRKMAETFGLTEMIKARFQKMLKKEGKKSEEEESEAGAFGGPGFDPLIGTIIGKEIARVYPSLGLAMGATLGLAGGTIMAKGTPAQKERWGLPILTFEKIGAWGMTEPESGSDAFALKTTAKPDGDYYILNGQKTFCTNAPYADIFVIYAKIDRGQEAKRDKRFIFPFVVERGTPGLSVSEPFKKMGMKGSPTGAVYLDDVRVHKSHLLGETEESARDQAKDVFAGERTGAPAMAWGIIERCLEVTVKYATERKQWDRPIGEFQLIQEKIARMYVHLENVRNIAFKHAWAQKEGKKITMKEACAAKLYCARAATECALEAIQALGGYGYMKEYRVEMLMRDAKLLQIGGGTDEIQILNIAKELLRAEGLEVKLGG